LSRGDTDHRCSDTPAGFRIEGGPKYWLLRVTLRPVPTDVQVDAGDVGTPELTSPRLHLPPFPAGGMRSPSRPVAFAYE
jgi:hypothetical protein